MDLLHESSLRVKVYEDEATQFFLDGRASLAMMGSQRRDDVRNFRNDKVSITAQCQINSRLID